MIFTELNDFSNILKQLQSLLLFTSIPYERMHEMLSKSKYVELSPKEFLFKKGESYHRGVYVILDGTMSLYTEEGSSLQTAYGDILGLSTFLGKSNYSVTAESENKTQLLFIPEICIYKLMEESEDFRAKYNKLTIERLTNITGGSPATVTQATYKSVGGCMTTPICTLNENSTVLEASKTMAEKKIGSIIIVDENKKLKGILTSKDLVHKFLANFEPSSSGTPVKNYMNPSPIAMPPEFPIVEAIAEMQNKGESYAIVVKSGLPIGLLSNKDLMKIVFQNINVYNTYINGLDTLDQLKAAHTKLSDTAKSLVSNSRLTSSILPILSSVHINIQKKVYEITYGAVDKDIKDTMNSIIHSMIIMGSGGRKEMLLDPDQDHGFILSNDSTPDDKKAFIKFGEKFSDNLEYVGYAKCKGNIMASNPEMVRTVKEWKRTISNWINNPGSDGLVWSSVFFDMDRFEGDETLVWDIKEFISVNVPKRPIFLIQMLERNANIRPPVSLFGKFNLEKDGDFKGTINLKVQALTMLVDITRAFTLHAGISDLNTLERVKHLQRKNILSEETVQSVITAHETIVDIILKSQIEQAENGIIPNKNIDPDQLSSYNQERLKSSLSFVTKYLTKGIKYFRGGI